MLQHFNQKQIFELSVSEIFVHPEWSAREHKPESNSAIIITNEKIPFEFFVFPTCFREYFLRQEKVYQSERSCQMINRRLTNMTMLEVLFANSNGGLYVQHNEKWFLYGFFSAEIAESRYCENKTLPSLSDVYKHIRCINHSQTTAVGTKASASYCSNELIFEDNFDTLDTSNWRHENTLAGGGNWEFSWYVPDNENSFVQDGILHIRPTRTDEKFGEEFLYRGTVNIPDDKCTRREFHGCNRKGSNGLINPIRSASIETINSFAFKYGTVEVRAKMSAGDWLASSITLLPKREKYGKWPKSGEIDMAETRGNRKLFEGEQNIGVDTVGFTLHFGPGFNKWDESHSEITNSSGFNSDFHVYKMKWTEESITLYVDDKQVYHIKTEESGLWDRFSFEGTNPWINGTKLAPFDQEFYLIISLKAGGIKFFPDDNQAKNEPHKKPWKNSSKKAAADFWNANDEWLETWIKNEVDFQIDYVRIFAL